MTIREVSEKYGIPADTLRYYERVGAIPPVHRTPSGIRDYDETDLSWVELARCLRAAGLPIEVLIRYVALTREGDETIPERLNLLKGEREHLLEQRAQIEETLARLNYKISHYEGLLKDGAAPGSPAP